MKRTKFFGLPSAPSDIPKNTEGISGERFSHRIVTYHFSFKAWPSVFLGVSRYIRSNAFRTFTSLRERKRVSRGSAIGVGTLIACLVAHCSGGVRSGCLWAENCDGVLLGSHFDG